MLADDTLRLLSDGQAARALRRCEEALQLWRGRPFGAVADEPWARPAVARLEELRAQVRERHIAAMLAIGDPERALVELTSAIADDPLRERLWVQRMLAYHRTGRTDRALATYQEARSLFRAELGIEPGGELRALQAQILAGDAAPPVPAPRGESAATEVHLPARSVRLIGRDPERDRVQALVAAHRLVSIVGAAGCGKTRLALDAARAAAGAFPDGVWGVDLTGAGAAEQVVTTVTSALGLALPPTGSARDALRSFSRDRRMLLLLDNCEHVLDAVAELVDDLLVDGSELAVLATSRVPLDVDGELVVPLEPLLLPAEGADPRTAPACELFLERLGTADDPDDATLERVARICRAVDGVPLAIELAAARARAYSLDEIAAQVTEDASTLGRIGRGPAGHHRTVRFAVEQSYRTLSAEEAALHRAVSVVPGPFTADVAAALVRRPVAEVRTVLARLVHCSLLVPLGPLGAGRPSRFAQLAIVRGHAAHSGDATETAELVAARDAWVGGLVDAAPRLGDAAEPDWFAALDDDLAALRATLQHCLADAPSALGVRVASRLGLYWYYRGMMVEARQWQERAAATEGDPVDRAWCGSCSAARWPWRTGATSPCRTSRTVGRSATCPPCASAKRWASSGARSSWRATPGSARATPSWSRRRPRRPGTRRSGSSPGSPPCSRRRRRPRPPTSSPLRPTCTTGRWRRRTPSSPGWPRTRRRTPRWPPATSRPACCGRTAWSPSTARCGCARARASSRSAPTCSRSRARPPPPSACTPRRGRTTNARA